jgi:hypothetical protein
MCTQSLLHLIIIIIIKIPTSPETNKAHANLKQFNLPIMVSKIDRYTYREGEITIRKVESHICCTYMEFHLVWTINWLQAISRESSTAITRPAELLLLSRHSRLNILDSNNRSRFLTTSRRVQTHKTSHRRCLQLYISIYFIHNLGIVCNCTCKSVYLVAHPWRKMAMPSDRRKLRNLPSSYSCWSHREQELSSSSSIDDHSERNGLLSRHI